VELIEEKSPMLASIIEANCPGAVVDVKDIDINGEGVNVTQPVVAEAIE
jgi:hypothetical protein